MSSSGVGVHRAVLIDDADDARARQPGIVHRAAVRSWSVDESAGQHFGREESNDVGRRQGCPHRSGCGFRAADRAVVHLDFVDLTEEVVVDFANAQLGHAGGW